MTGDLVVTQLIDGLSRAAAATARWRRRTLGVTWGSPAVLVTWVMALLVAGALPGAIGTAVIVVVALCWLVGLAGLALMTASLGRIETGLHQATESIRRNVGATGGLPTNSQDLVTLLTDRGRLSLQGVWSIYRKLPSSLGVAKSVGTSNVGTYLYGIWALFGLLALGGLGLLILVGGLVGRAI